MTARFPYRAATNLDLTLQQYLADNTKPLASIGDAANGAAAANTASAVSTDAIATVDTTAATNTSPFGYSEAQANAIVAAVNLIIARQASIITTVNQLISDMGSNASLIQSNDTSAKSKINELLAAFRTAGKMET